MGMTSVSAGDVSSSDASAGAQFGLNLIVSKNLAVNFHLLQFDVIFADDTELLLTQSIGIKYFFE